MSESWPSPPIANDKRDTARIGESAGPGRPGKAFGSAGGRAQHGTSEMGSSSMAVPARKAVWSGGIGHQASARASWLIDPAPRLAGVATGSPPRSGDPAPGASVTSTQYSMPGG